MIELIFNAWMGIKMAHAIFAHTDGEESVRCERTKIILRTEPKHCVIQYRMGSSRGNHTHVSEKMQQGPLTLQPMDIKIYVSTHYGACHKLISSTNLKVSHQMLVIFGVFWSPLTYPHPMHIETAGNEVNCC